MADISKIGNEGVWRNEGYEEEIVPLKGYRGLTAVTVEHFSVVCEHDPNFSTSFQMRHVVDVEGNRGFMFYVGPQYLHIREVYRQGASQEIYDEVKRWGTAYQQEALRRSYLELNKSR